MTPYRQRRAVWEAQREERRSRPGGIPHDYESIWPPPTPTDEELAAWQRITAEIAEAKIVETAASEKLRGELQAMGFPVTTVEQPQDQLKEEAKVPALTSSYQKLQRLMPPTGRRMYEESVRLAKLHPSGADRFDTGQDDMAQRLGCSASTAWLYIQLHLKAKVWIEAERASCRERRQAGYRLASLVELDFESAGEVYRAHTAAMTARRLKNGWLTKAEVAAQAEAAEKAAGTTSVPRR